MAPSGLSCEARQMRVENVRLLGCALCAVLVITGVAEGAQEKVSAEQTRQKETAGPAETDAQSPPKTVGERPEGPTESHKEIDTIFERQGVLTPRRRMVLEYSNQYSYASSTRVAIIGYYVIPAITLGLIDVRSVGRHTYIGAMSGRYGLTNRLELEAKAPYVVRDDVSYAQPLATTAPDSAFSAYGNSIGDVEFGLRYQLNMPQGNGHIFIAGLRAKSDTGKGPFDVPVDPATNLPTGLATGSGFWALQPSLTIILPSDPAVLFGSLNYMFSIDKTILDSRFCPASSEDQAPTVCPARISPGRSIGGNFGVGYAINEKMAFSLGYEHNVILKTKLNGQTLARGRTAFVGSLLLGVSYRVAPNLNINFSISGGLTEDAPDMQFTMRIPFSFGGVRKPR